MGHDSAFKDKNFALQCVRVGFIPTEKTDIRDLGPMDEVFSLAYVLFTLISHRSPAVLRALFFAGWFHYHKAAPEFAWFQDVEFMLNHYLGLIWM